VCVCVFVCVCADPGSNAEPGTVPVRQGGEKAEPAQHPEVHQADEQSDRLPSHWGGQRGEILPWRLANHLCLFFFFFFPVPEKERDD